MAICSSITAWKIPWTEEPGWLQSLRSPSVGHDRVTERTLTLTHMHSFHHRLLQDIEYSSLCYTVGPYWLFILYGKHLQFHAINCVSQDIHMNIPIIAI